MATPPADFDPYPALSTDCAPRAAYFHVPFCFHRCGYCDFTLVAERDDLIPAWFVALENELSRLSQSYEVDSIFIGGGTPTHLTVPQLTQLIELIGESFTLVDGGECSIEANPDGLDNDRLNALADLGVNRISLGVQSFDAAVLKTLERHHTATEAVDVVERASERFSNVSLDLIFGVPGLTFDCWRDSLQMAISLPLQHVSTYGLTFEKGTDFFQRRKKGELLSVSDDVERDMYAAAIDDTSNAGFRHYEVSNFAKPGFECQHNMVYWSADEYFAFGPGAARYVAGTRSTNSRNVVRWINRWSQNEVALQESECLNSDERIREDVFLGLRLVDGIDLQSFQDRFDTDLLQYAHAAITKHMADGYLEVVDERLRLTREGRFVADWVVSDFL